MEQARIKSSNKLVNIIVDGENFYIIGKTYIRTIWDAIGFLPVHGPYKLNDKRFIMEGIN
jgi:hypothetical protein